MEDSMKQRNIDDFIRTQLEKSVQGAVPSVSCKEKLDSRISRISPMADAPHRRQKEERMKKHWNTWQKAAAAIGICTVLGGGTAFAGTIIAGKGGSSSLLTEKHHYSDLSKAEKETGITSGLPESLPGDYQFGWLNTGDTYDIDEDGNRHNQGKELIVSYQGGQGDEVTIYVSPSAEQNSPEEDMPCQETRSCEGISIFYSDTEYLFVPPDYKPTEEEAAREKEDPFFTISYGSDEKKTSDIQSILFDKNGLTYSFVATDSPLTADDLFGMAESIIQK